MAAASAAQAMGSTRAVEMPFRFLDLHAGKAHPRSLTSFRALIVPAVEVRNRVYDFASTTGEPIRISKKKPSNKSELQAPFAALTQVCRQIRQEYIKIQRRNASLEIVWEDMPAYFDTYHGDSGHADIAPLHLCFRIPVIPEFGTCGDRTYIDIYPLVLLRARNQDMHYTFITAGDGNPEVNDQAEMRAHDLRVLCQERATKWLDLVRTGRVDHIDVDKETARVWGWDLSAISVWQWPYGSNGREYDLTELGIDESSEFRTFDVIPMSYKVYDRDEVEK